jgi:hypothetical protein
MKELRVTLPELGLIASTRAALGGGAALLLAERLNKKHREAVGWTLLMVGIVTSIPLAALVLGRRR